MGSSLSPTLSNIFVSELESKIMKKYIKTKKIVFYSRFTDDSLVIIEKKAVKSFMKEINKFDKSLNFTINYMKEEKITFLDMTIFVNKDQTLELKKYRKNSLDTVMTNFEESISSPKYKKGAIFTNLHREFDASSSQENFLETLEELKEVYSRNSYPSALVNSKIKKILADREKPERKPTNHTICLEYQSPLIEHSICDLTRRMSKLLPDFRVNVSYRVIKISKLFSYLAKAQIEFFEKSNVTYCYNCPCEAQYIGQTLRMLKTRIREHQMPSCYSNINLHILSCEKYKNEAQRFIDKNIKNFTSPPKAQFEFFKNRFKIIGKGFRNKKDRERNEAFLIRTKKPSLNDQFDHNAFKLF